MPITTEQSLEDATAALISADPDLREELRGLIRDAIARYRHTIRWGSPDARLSAIKAIIPGMIRAMGRVELSESDKQLREAYEEIRAATGASAPPPIVLEIEAAAVVKKAVRKRVKKAP